MKNNSILWILQTNQLTPVIADFFHLVKTRMAGLVDLTFMVPSRDGDALEMAKELQPDTFSLTARGKERSYSGYLKKKALLSGGEYAQGLPFHEPLLLDDLGGGSIQQPLLHLPKFDEIKGVVLQIPTPLGSSEMEEKTAHTWILWAKHQKIPILGYELLPLDTRWSLVPAMLDGVITTREASYDHLKHTLPDSDKIWLLPPFERKILSPASTKFAISGARAAYHFQNTLAIPQGRSVLFIPHNVAMVHEYKTLLQSLQGLGEKLHLMFSTGKDQIRGAHDHQTIIETVCRRELEHFASHSFHDINAPWEMAMADVVVACSSCFNTCIAEAHTIPTIIFDDTSAPFSRGWTRKVSRPRELSEAIETIMAQNTKKTELAAILANLLKTQATP